MHRLATIHNITDDDEDRRNSVPIAQDTRDMPQIVNNTTRAPCGFGGSTLNISGHVTASVT